MPPVIRRLEDGTQEFSEIRRGFPAGPAETSAGQFNFRSEGRRFPVPKSGIGYT